MDFATKAVLEKLRRAREELAEVDTVHSPDVAGHVQVELIEMIASLEKALHAKVADLDGIIRVGEHRMTYNYRMDREDILAVLGSGQEPEPRDTPKLNALMKGDDDIFKTVDAAGKDFRPNLEDLLFAGHDKALTKWVDGLSPVQLGVLMVMGPRLVALIQDKFAILESMQGPGDYAKKMPYIVQGSPRQSTRILNDPEAGTFDD